MATSRFYQYVSQEDFDISTHNGSVPPNTIWTGFKDRTTAHGVPHCNTAKGTIKRAFWALVSLICVGFLIYHLTTVTNLFLRYKVNVVVSLVSQREITFPAVTVCNMNPVKASALKYSPLLNSAINSKKKKRKRRAVSLDCDYPTYTDTDGSEICFWVPDKLTKSYDAVLDAQAACTSGGGNLAVLDVEAKWKHVNKEKICDKRNCWIGLRRRKADKNWYWFEKKTLLTDEYWDGGYPMGGVGRCVVSTGGGGWRNVQCKEYADEALPLCQKYVEAYTTVAATTEEADVTSTWEYPTTVEDTTAPPSETTESKETTNIPPSSFPTTLSDTTAVTSEDPTTTSEDPTTTSEDPTTTSEDPTTTSEDPTTTSENPTTASEDPTTTSEDPTTTSENPTTTSEDPTTTSEDPTITSEDPTTTSEDPTTTSRTTATTSEPATTTTTETTTTTTSATTKTTIPDVPVISEDFVKDETVIEVLSDLPEEEKQKLGYTSDEFILSCQYSGFDCYTSQFSFVYDAVHGNCYTFNWNQTLGFKTSYKTGRRYGLKMILNIQQDEYVDSITESAGARIVVHSQDRMPFPQDEGIMLPPGELSSIGVRKPYGDCTDPNKKNINRNVFEEYYPVKYSTKACYRTCYQSVVMAECACADPAYPRYGAAFRYQNVTSCKITDALQESCRQAVTTNYNNDEIECDCPNPCNEISYEFTMSTARWPSDVHETSLLEKVGSKVNGTEHRKNLLKAEVYYEELNYEKIKEKPAYRIGNYLSDLGGILGLWVGCSVLSIFEFIELGMDFLVLGFYKLMGNPSATSGTGNAASPSTQKPTPTKMEDKPPGDSSACIDDRALRDFAGSLPPAYSSLSVHRKTRLTRNNSTVSTYHGNNTSSDDNENLEFI